MAIPIFNSTALVIVPTPLFNVITKATFDPLLSVSHGNDGIINIQNIPRSNSTSASNNNDNNNNNHQTLLVLCVITSIAFLFQL